MDDNLLIKAENEWLITGEHPVTAGHLDAAEDHINLHKEILKAPIYWNNIEIVTRVINHIQEHIDILGELSGRE